MCHFGPDPTGVLNVKTGEVSPVEYKGTVNLTTYNLDSPKPPDLTEVGWYWGIATGAGPVYFDGEYIYNPNYKLLYPDHGPSIFDGFARIS